MIPTLTYPYPFHPGGVHTIFRKSGLLHGSSLPEKGHFPKFPLVRKSPSRSFIAAIRDPTHAEHNSNLQWVGGSFDPSAFDLADVNDRLSMIKA